MLLTNTVNSLGDSLIAIGSGALHFVPVIIAAIVVFALGLLIANIVGRLITELAHALKIDAALSRTGLRDALRRAGMSLNAGAFIGGFVKWVIVLAFTITALEILGLTQVTAFLTDILGYVPQLIAAAIILVATAIIAEFLKKLVASSARVIEAGGAGFAGSAIKTTVWVFGVVVALQELGLPTALFQIVITGIVAALALGFGLAFGLGGRDTASKIIDKTYTEMHK